jgi:hypothetical protein
MFGHPHHDKVSGVPYLGATHAVGEGDFSVAAGALTHQMHRSRFGHPHGEHDSEHMGRVSHVIPPPHSTETVTPVHLHLDGHKVASSVLKRVRRAMNGPSMGSRLPDYSSARPMPV